MSLMEKLVSLNQEANFSLRLLVPITVKGLQNFHLIEQQVVEIKNQLVKLNNYVDERGQCIDKQVIKALESEATAFGSFRQDSLVYEREGNAAMMESLKQKFASIVVDSDAVENEYFATQEAKTTQREKINALDQEINREHQRIAKEEKEAKAAEAEEQKRKEQEAELKRQAAEEEQMRMEQEAERKRQAAEQELRRKKEAGRKRKAEEELERKANEEVERKRKAKEAEAERKRNTKEEEAERKRKAKEDEAERKRKAKEEEAARKKLEEEHDVKESKKRGRPKRADSVPKKSPLNSNSKPRTPMKRKVPSPSPTSSGAEAEMEDAMSRASKLLVPLSPMPQAGQNIFGTPESNNNNSVGQQNKKPRIPETPRKTPAPANIGSPASANKATSSVSTKSMTPQTPKKNMTPQTPKKTVNKPQQSIVDTPRNQPSTSNDNYQATSAKKKNPDLEKTMDTDYGSDLDDSFWDED